MVILAWRIDVLLLYLGVGTRESIRKYTSFGASMSLH